MAALRNFLSAIFAGSDDPIILFAGDDEIEVAENLQAACDALADEPELYTTPLFESRVAFMVAVVDNAQREQWADENLRPTAVLYRDATLLMIYALEQAAERNVDLDGLAGDMGFPIDDLIPTPGANGWELVHLDEDAFASLADLDEVFNTAEEDEPVPLAVPGVPGKVSEAAPWDSADYGTLNDARLLTPLDLTAPEYQQPMKVSLGAGVDSKRWKVEQMPVATLVDLLSTHRESPHKDGLAFVLAEIIGDQRKKVAVKACYGVGLDIDVGVPGHIIDEALVKLGCLAVRYTTHSHYKTKTGFLKSRLIKWCDKNNLDLEKPVDFARFLREEAEWDETMIESAEYIGDEHVQEGLMAYVTHDPFPKHRVVLPLSEAFEPAVVARTHEEGMKLWADVCRGLAKALGDLPMDRSAVDPSRLFYFPRHAANRPFETTIVGGRLLRWQELDLSLAEDVSDIDPDSLEGRLLNEIAASEKERPKSKSTTDAGKALGRWSIKYAGGFQIADVIRDHADDRIRTHGANKIDIECPFDEEHSNAGDLDDRACMAVNAGDGSSDIFTIRCQHHGCVERTNLDMLGKMITDGWFDESVLQDDNYNALLEEEAAPQTPEAAKIIAEDDARAEYERLVDNLNTDSDDEEVDTALKAVIEANLSPRAMMSVEKKLKTNLGMTQQNLTKLIKMVKRQADKQDNAKGGVKDPKGRFVFAYENEFNFDEAFDSCFNTLLLTNKRDGEPTFSCVQDQLVRLSRNPKNGRLSFDKLTKDGLWAELNRRMTFMRRTDNGDGARDAVPEAVSKYVFEQGYTMLPQSPEIIYTPLFTALGDMVVTPGYKPELNLLMANTNFQVSVPDIPTADDVEEAVRFLREEVLCDFPFLDYNLEGIECREASEANCLAMLITPFMRRMVNGCTPVFFVAKPTPGTGGTLLGKLPMLIFDGAESAPMRYTQNEEEMQKALLSAIIETRSHLFFDDVLDFNNRSLLQSITAQEIGGRELGVTRNISRPNLFNWVATGNNPHVRAEMERRICWIRLNALTPDIQKRRFKHDDFPGFVMQNRSLIISHILTLIQYWIDMGMPLYEERRRASFEDWSRKVGGVLMCAGVTGFLSNRPPMASDMDETANRTFIKEWLKKFQFEQVSVHKLFDHALMMELDIIEGNNDDQKKQRFPKKLHTLNGRVFVVNGIPYVVRAGLDLEGDPVFSLSKHEPEENSEAAIAA